MQILTVHPRPDYLKHSNSGFWAHNLNGISQFGRPTIHNYSPLFRLLSLSNQIICFTYNFIHSVTSLTRYREIRTQFLIQYLYLTNLVYI